MQKIDKNIDALLESLNGIQRANAPDFFHTRLIAKLERDQPSTKSRTWGFILKPLPALAVLGCLIALNIYTLTAMMGNTSRSSATQQEGIMSFASEYDLYNSTDVTNKTD